MKKDDLYNVISNEEKEEQEEQVVEEGTADTVEEKGKGKSKKIIAIVLLVAIVLLLILAVVRCGRGDSNDDQVNKFDLVYDTDAEEGGREERSQEEIQAELNKQVEDGMMNISMNLNPIFANGTAKGDLLIVNEDVNRHPQVIEIFRNDNGEKIYQSGVIPVGSKVESAKLAVDLPKGEYPCTAYFNYVDEGTGEVLGKAGAEIVISVKG